MVMPDTNTVIYFFKGLGGVPDRWLDTPPSELSIPSVVLYEIEVGIAKSSRPKQLRDQLDHLVRHCNVEAFDRNAARAAARIRAALEEKGQPIGPMDTLIAGTAVSRGATLITRNVDEFSRVPGLTTDNWYDEGTE